MKSEEEKIQEDKDAVASMARAQRNMSAALSRISKLESALASAISALDNCKGYTPRDAYQYNSTKRIHEYIDAAIASARSVL